MITIKQYAKAIKVYQPEFGIRISPLGLAYQ
jgi:hypothetical protein